jgi:hypothetical protein
MSTQLQTRYAPEKLYIKRVSEFPKSGLDGTNPLTILRKKKTIKIRLKSIDLP